MPSAEAATSAITNPTARRRCEVRAGSRSASRTSRCRPALASTRAMPALATGTIGLLAVATVWLSLSCDGIIGWVTAALV